MALPIIALIPRRANHGSLKIFRHTHSGIKEKSGSVFSRSSVKWGIFGTVVVGGPSIWYALADGQEKRKLRVTVQGIGRFLR